MSSFLDKFSDINNLLDLQSQNWLFGAGISRNANIPLMGKLTKLVEENMRQEENHSEMFKEIKELFNKISDMHIEHILSHIGDLIALIERTGNEEMKIGEYSYNKSELYNMYSKIIKEITKIIRYGYYENEEGESSYGSIENPLVEIEEHRNFIKALFSRLENFESRSSINFFTTNYDTLLEDALILEKKNVIDGFTGTAMAFWDPETFEEKDKDNYLVCKLHGSIDWYRNEQEGLVRARYGTTYLKKTENTMIYPQATKYVETQKDPFAFLFEEFRKTLHTSSNSILCICGYSLGDNHINNEIESALLASESQLTLLIFLEEFSENHKVNDWLRNPEVNDRVYVMTHKGIYHENEFHPKISENNLDWWTFSGLTELLRKGEEYNV